MKNKQVFQVLQKHMHTEDRWSVIWRSLLYLLLPLQGTDDTDGSWQLRRGVLNKISDYSRIKN